MTIYDGFTFFNELDMLRVRLVEHGPFVDKFILVEGNRTFSGEPKPCYFDPTDCRFREFRHKIIHVTAFLHSSPCDAWRNEQTQRRAILSAITPSPDDLVLIGDVDEIVSRHSWLKLLSEIESQGAIAIRMACYYYYLNLRTPEHIAASKLFRYDYLSTRQLDTERARWLSTVTARPRVWKVPDSFGWHFSYLGTPEFIRNKIASFAHQEFNNSTYAAPERIARAVEQKIDLFGRWPGQRFVAEKVDERWPIEMYNNPFWHQYQCPPDAAPRRIGWKIAHKLNLMANGVAARIPARAARGAGQRLVGSEADPGLAHAHRSGKII